MMNVTEARALTGVAWVVAGEVGAAKACSRQLVKNNSIKEERNSGGKILIRRSMSNRKGGHNPDGRHRGLLPPRPRQRIDHDVRHVFRHFVEALGVEGVD